MVCSLDRCALWTALATVGLAIFTPHASASDVVEIEEHWSLSVGGPDVDRSAPQVSMVMSASGDIEADYFILLLNHWAGPEFAPGGVQAQHWNGDDLGCVANAPTNQSLSHDGETVTWVQRLSLAGDQLVFEIDEGQSLSWGNFSSNESLRLVAPTALTRLNGYRPAVSIEESGIGFAGNRVSALVLQRIRWRFADTDEWQEMVAPIDIDSDLDP